MNFSTSASLIRFTDIYAKTTESFESDSKYDNTSINDGLLVAFIVTVTIFGITFVFGMIYTCRKSARNKHEKAIYEIVSMSEIDTNKEEINNSRSTTDSIDSGFCNKHDRLQSLQRNGRNNSTSSSLCTDTTLSVVTEIEIGQHKDSHLHHKTPEGPIYRENNKIRSQIYPCEPKILKVKPLKAAENDDETTHNSEGSNQGVLVNQPLDWNKVFRFLTNTINATEWKLFFIDLFSCGQHLLPFGQTINNKIEHIASSSKGSQSARLFDLFEAWHSLMGIEAHPDQIEKVLRERGDNEALGKFKDLMRHPPLMPTQHTEKKQPAGIGGKQYRMILHKPIECYKSALDNFVHSQTQVMALHDVVHYNNGSGQFPHHRDEVIFGLMDKHEQTLSLTAQTKESDKQSQLDIFKSSSGDSIIKFGGKRSRSDSNVTSSDDECSQHKSRKREKISSPTLRKSVKKRRRRANDDISKCEELVQWEMINKGYIIELIKRLLLSDSQIFKAEEYHLLLYHTVSLVVKRTGASENTILSVLVADFHKAHRYKSDRGHVTFILDTEMCNLALGETEWENLKLFTENARTRVVKRLIIGDSDFVASKYLFIDYDGKPVIAMEDELALQDNDDDEMDPGITTQQNIDKIKHNKHVENMKSDIFKTCNGCGAVNVTDTEDEMSPQSQELLDKVAKLPNELNVFTDKQTRLNNQSCNAEASASFGADKTTKMLQDTGIKSMGANEKEMNALEFLNDDVTAMSKYQDSLPSAREKTSPVETVGGMVAMSETKLEEAKNDSIESLITDISKVIDVLSSGNENQTTNTPDHKTINCCPFEDTEKCQCPGFDKVDYKRIVNTFNKVPRRRNSI